MRRLFLIGLSLFLCGLASTQTVSNVRSAFSCPGEMTINYDLSLEDSEKPTNITVSYSTDNGQTYHPCATITGDLKNQSTGSNKSVTWDMKADGFKTGFFIFKVEAELAPEPECVMINGVCWATCNVDAPGTFTDNPEDPGMFYQWNRSQGWAATGSITGWDSSTPAGTTWETTNNVCPTGYRVPTDAEIQSLIASGSRWITQNGVTGRVFGSGDNLIFLPAAGSRNYSYGALFSAGTDGYYWSSTPYGSNVAYYLYFYSGVAYRDYRYRNSGFSVRCVAE